MDTIIIVTEWISGQPVVGAKVQLIPEIGEAEEMFSDENGEANFGEVWAGLYTIAVDHSAYSPERRRVELPATVHIAMVPWVAVVVGVPLASATVLLFAWWLSGILAQ